MAWEGMVTEWLAEGLTRLCPQSDRACDRRCQILPCACEEAERRKMEKLGEERASRRLGGHVCHPEDGNEAISAGAREGQVGTGPCPGLGTL